MVVQVGTTACVVASLKCSVSDGTAGENTGVGAPAIHVAWMSPYTRKSLSLCTMRVAWSR